MWIFNVFANDEDNNWWGDDWDDDDVIHWDKAHEIGPKTCPAGQKRVKIKTGTYYRFAKAEYWAGPYFIKANYKYENWYT